MPDDFGCGFAEAPPGCTPPLGPTFSPKDQGPRSFRHVSFRLPAHPFRNQSDIARACINKV